MEVDIVYGLAIAAVVLSVIAQTSRIIRAAAMHKTLRLTIEKGQTLDPELIDGLDKNAEPGSGDQRIGFVLIAIALALFAAAAINNTSEDNLRAMASIAMFPLFVGSALLLRLRFAARNRAES
jgi:hypothetical protein